MWKPSEKQEERRQPLFTEERIEMLKFLSPLFIVPAVLLVIGVMFVAGWNSEPNQNAWWTEVRKEQEALEAESVVAPEYLSIEAEPQYGKQLDAEHTCKAFGGTVDCGLEQEGED